ncbi:MAG: hypothetical protein KAS93_05395 [Gammaproteobacteria bacterium]|nr:hypothetical protein [Gammaproteobacteria bacterium]
MPRLGSSRAFFVTICSSLLLTTTSSVFAATAKTTSNLRKLVLQQQKQLALQAKEIKQLQQEMHTVKTTRQQRVIIYKRPTTPKHSKKRTDLFKLKVNKKLVKFHVKGQFNQAMIYSNDSRQNKLFFTTNENSVSRVNIGADIHPSDKITVGGHVELGLKLNSSSAVTQNDPTPPSSIDMRKIEVFVKTKHLGNLWLGKGSTATDNTSEIDLSGTTVAAYSPVNYIGGGLYFRTPGSDVYTNNPQVNDAFDNLDGFSRKSRIGYDTPKFHGAWVSASAMENNSADVALKIKQNFHNIKFAGAIGQTTKQTINDVRGNVTDGSFSVLLPNGLNGTVAAGYVNAIAASRKDPNYYYVKLGLLRKYFHLGKTAVSLDYGKYSNFDQNNDIGKTYGADIVQYLEGWNLAIYAGYRKFMLTRTSASFKNINIVLAGAIFKFNFLR